MVREVRKCLATPPALPPEFPCLDRDPTPVDILKYPGSLAWTPELAVGAACDETKATKAAKGVDLLGRWPPTNTRDAICLVRVYTSNLST